MAAPSHSLPLLLFFLVLCVCVRALKTSNTYVLLNTHGGGEGVREGVREGGGETYMFTQRLDHFSATDPRTFQQRYFVDNQYWGGEDEPLVVYISGEATASLPTTGEAVILAQRYKASFVTLEHRYYGQSYTFTNYSTPNLHYLTTRQALADLANFISYYVTAVLPPVRNGRRVLTIGGSYAGALSAWFRLKYPDVTCASVSSSGVVNAILDFTAFDEQVAESVGPSCADALRQVTSTVEKLILQGGSAAASVKNLFKADDLVDNGDFFYFLADSMAEGVQYGYQDSVCDPLLQAIKNKQNILDAYAGYLSSVWTVKLGNNAGNYATAYQQNTTIGIGMDRLWWWQTCNELAYFQNAPAKGSIRSQFVNMTYHRDHCERVFGQPVWPDTDAVNKYYGGDHIAATKVYFANGSQDPWKRASVLLPLSFSEPASTATCHNCGHCVDLRGCPNGCSDPYVVDKIRDDVIRYVDTWLQEC